MLPFPGMTECPFRRADARRLIDLKIGDAVLAKIVPVLICKPCRTCHGAGLMRGPETEGQPAPHLVTVFEKYPCQLHLTGVVGGIVSRGLPRPTVLMAADTQ